jgi:hypothetical protein
MYCIQDQSAGGDKDNDCDGSGAVTFKIKPSTNIATCMDTNPAKTSTRGLRNHKQRCYKKEELDFINDLKKRNDALLCGQKRLQGKLKMASITVQRLKEQVQTWKRRCNASMNQQCSSISARGANLLTEYMVVLFMHPIIVEQKIMGNIEAPVVAVVVVSLVVRQGLYQIAPCVITMQKLLGLVLI